MRYQAPNNNTQDARNEQDDYVKSTRMSESFTFSQNRVARNVCVHDQDDPITQ